MTRIAFVVARDRGGVIGKGGTLPWRLPDDMKHVRSLTIGKPLIMGRRTYDSIGHPLPERTNIVMTRDPGFKADGVKVARTPEEALAIAGDAPEVIVFGGAEVFTRFLPMTDRIYMTEVDADSAGDTFFPALDPAQWRETERVEHPADARHAHSFRFITLERQR
ncbi:MAG TPA: dihydrofolate reductase [Candidatus Limnocylindrales bacterium]|nr:dihydrofolate reductase [Candidatus Limnocylindrales bacterium]